MLVVPSAPIPNIVLYDCVLDLKFLRTPPPRSFLLLYFASVSYYAQQACGVDVINTGIGWHEARIPTIATSVPRGAWSWVTKKLKAEGGLTVPLCATNRINMPETVCINVALNLQGSFLYQNLEKS